MSFRAVALDALSAFAASHSTTLLQFLIFRCTTMVVACTYAIPYGVLQHTPRMVPGLSEVRNFAPLPHSGLAHLFLGLLDYLPEMNERGLVLPKIHL